MMDLGMLKRRVVVAQMRALVVALLLGKMASKRA